MEDHQHPFEWIKFPEGRARFAGGVRGWDEAGHDTFAIEIEGREWFGELRSSFLANGNDFNIEIVSFGYSYRDSVGMPLPCLGSRAFNQGELEHVRALILSLVEAGMEFSIRPNVLLEYPGAHFLGSVFFREGWAAESAVP